MLNQIVAIVLLLKVVPLLFREDCMEPYTISLEQSDELIRQQLTKLFKKSPEKLELQTRREPYSFWPPAEKLIKEIINGNNSVGKQPKCEIKL